MSKNSPLVRRVRVSTKTGHIFPVVTGQTIEQMKRKALKLGGKGAKLFTVDPIRKVNVCYGYGE